MALGDCVGGAFTNNSRLWELIHAAGSETGDRVWRLPLFKHYAKQMTGFAGHDVNNMGSGPGMAGSCKAAAFLRQFVAVDQPWVHLDVANLRRGTDQLYTGPDGMAGRPMRTLVEFVAAVQRTGFGERT